MPPTASLPRSCPRCTSRLFHAADQYGGYSSCVACGFVHEWVSGPAIELPDDDAVAAGHRRRSPTYRKVRL